MFLPGVSPPAKICLDWRKNLSPLGIPPFFKQGLADLRLTNRNALAGRRFTCAVFLPRQRRFRVRIPARSGPAICAVRQIAGPERRVFFSRFVI